MTTPAWDALPDEHRELICVASQLGQYHRSESDLLSSRKDLAIGLAAIDVFQQLSQQQYIDASTPMSKMISTWEDGANIAVKWLRLVDLNKPTFWYKYLPEKQWNDKRLYYQAGDRIHYKYRKYAPFLMELSRKKALSMPNFKHLWSKIHDVQRITQLMPLLTYGEEYKIEFESPVASFKETPGRIRDQSWLIQRKTITGCLIKATDKGFVQTATRAESQIIFEASLPRTWPRYKQLSSEVEHCWSLCETNSEEDEGGDIAWLTYFYFSLLSPFTENNSEVGFALTLGMLLSMQRQIRPKNGRYLNDGVILLMETLKSANPLDWLTTVADHYETTFIPPEEFKTSQWTQLSRVNDKFSTLRKMIQVLNIDHYQHCSDGKAI